MIIVGPGTVVKTVKGDVYVNGRPATSSMPEVRGIRYVR